MIGILDSGTGGLTVARALLEQLGTGELVFFGDTAHAPYGTKSAAVIERFARQGVDLLLEAGATHIVFRLQYHCQFGPGKCHVQERLSFFSALAPAVKMALAVSDRLKIGIIGTTGLVRSQTWLQEIHRRAPQARVFAADGSLLSMMVEAGWHNKPETAMTTKKCFHGLKCARLIR